MQRRIGLGSLSSIFRRGLLALADLIERRFGKPRLIDCVGEPIQFLETYNEAARLEKREG